MGEVDPRAPVIVGAGQATHRDRDQEVSPLELMASAARLAIEDAGGGVLSRRVDCLAAVEVISWPVPDPAAALACELRLDPGRTARTERGGSGPLELLGDLCERIQSGELETALIAGAEAFNPFMRAAREGRDTGWEGASDGRVPTWLVGNARDASHPAETAAGLIAPVTYYPWLESTVRGAAGRTPDEHFTWLAELWGRFAAVARDNPYAWQRDAPDAAGIGSEDGGNRMVAFPYRKLMTANIQVDQGAALLLCSAKAATAAGVPRDRWVFVDSIATAHDEWFAAERRELHCSPALAACGAAALGHAGVGIDDVAHLDLYACFPSAVQMAASELGLDLHDDPRPPTVTGGLTFAGGPGNNYCTHALATLTARLRADPDQYALATGLGWYSTKHAVAVLSGRPPPKPFAHRRVQGEVDGLPARRVARDTAGPAPIEAYTAIYDREGRPSVGIASFLLEDGRRAIAKTDEPDSLAALVEGDPLGRPAQLDGQGRFTLDGS